MKKISAILLALILVLSMSSVAMAAQEGTLTGGSITINDAVPGQTYKAYQILYLESYDAGSGAYAYKANSAWETWLKTQKTYVSFDAQGYVTWVAGADAEAFAKLAQQQAATMTADATAIAPAAAEGEVYSTVSFTGLKLGYYLVDTTLGTLCSLDTTNPNVEMYEKNSEPGFGADSGKTVKEDSTGVYGAANDADRGQVVEFKVVFTATKGAQNYVLHDVMDAGLSLNSDSIVVKAGSTQLTASTDYVVSTTNDDHCTFEIALTETYANSITSNTNITVEYTATLTATAAINTAIKNKAWLTYGENGKSVESETTTKTFAIPVFKYTVKNNAETALAGAQFKLYRMVDNTKEYYVNTNGEVTWTATASDATVYTTTETGTISFEGVDAGDYFIEEAAAPAGYNKLAGDVAVTVGRDGTLTGASVDNGTRVKVLNQTGSELPSTGGMGTTIFYVVGGLLMAAAVVLLVTKKKVSAR